MFLGRIPSTDVTIRFGSKGMGATIIIAGSVGSGKTTWVRERKTWGDLVLDVDMLWTALMGGEHHPRGAGIGPRRRDRRT